MKNIQNQLAGVLAGAKRVVLSPPADLVADSEQARCLYALSLHLVDAGVVDADDVRPIADKISAEWASRCVEQAKLDRQL